MRAKRSASVMTAKRSVSETLLYALRSSTRRRETGRAMISANSTRAASITKNEEDARICEKVFRTESDQEPRFTEPGPLKSFCEAEEYHQKYLEKNPEIPPHFHQEDTGSFAGPHRRAAKYSKPPEEKSGKTYAGTVSDYAGSRHGTAFSHPYLDEEKKEFTSIS